jgi:hypothetical protein
MFLVQFCSRKSKKKRGALIGRPVGEEEGGTLALRLGLYRQLANCGGGLLAVGLVVLNGHTSAGNQVTASQSLRVDRESHALFFAANLLDDDHLIRADRSDRTLGEMCCRLECFRLGSGGRVGFRFAAVLAAKDGGAKGESQDSDQSESVNL